MNIKLSDHFTTLRLLKFTFPSIIMMIFTSIYNVVDGLFISRFVGSNALSAINIIAPLMILLGTFGFMLGAGGSAEVSKKLGENDEKTAKNYFTILAVAVAVISISLSMTSLIFLRPIAYKLGATDLIIEDCMTYGTFCMFGCVFFMLQTFFQSFFVVAARPHIGLFLTVLSGVLNMVLDWLFIVVLDFGIAGAAVASVLGCVAGSIIPIFYFLLPNTSKLRFQKPKFEYKVLIRSMINGSSEMVSNLSMALTAFLFNIQLMKLVGEVGVAAIGIINYTNFIFIAMFIGFSMGSAPVISFNYGAENHTELKGLFKICIRTILIASVVIFAIAEIASGTIVSVFTGDDIKLANITLTGFRIFALSFLVCGMNIFSSAFFTALCNGKISAVISFLRALVFQSAMIVILPMIFGLNGVWFALPIAELIALLISIGCLIAYRKKYQYA